MHNSLSFNKELYLDSPRLFLRFLMIVNIVHLNLSDKTLTVSPSTKLFLISSFSMAVSLFAKVSLNLKSILRKLEQKM